MHAKVQLKLTWMSKVILVQNSPFCVSTDSFWLLPLVEPQKEFLHRMRTVDFVPHHLDQNHVRTGSLHD